MLKKVVSVLQQAVVKIVHPEGPPRVLHLPNIFVIHYSSATSLQDSTTRFIQNAPRAEHLDCPESLISLQDTMGTPFTVLPLLN